MCVYKNVFMYIHTHMGIWIYKNVYMCIYNKCICNCIYGYVCIINIHLYTYMYWASIHRNIYNANIYKYILMYVVLKI